jgi:hypothetical protein
MSGALFACGSNVSGPASRRRIEAIEESEQGKLVCAVFLIERGPMRAVDDALRLPYTQRARA